MAFCVVMTNFGHRCKVVIYNYVFFGFYSVPNLIVIFFNLMYPVFHVGFICKGCVWEKESVKTQGYLKTKVVFAGSSQVSFPRSDACALYMTGMWKIKTGWRQLVFASVLRVKPSRGHSQNILFCQIVISDTLYPYPHYLYPHYPHVLRSASERKP